MAAGILSHLPSNYSIYGLAMFFCMKARCRGVLRKCSNSNDSEREMNSTEESVAGAAAIYTFNSSLSPGVLLSQIWILHPSNPMKHRLS